MKAVETWTDLGLGSFELCDLRVRQKRGVDFAVIRDGSLFYLRGVTLKKILTTTIYKGVIPFILIQLIGLLVIYI